MSLPRLPIRRFSRTGDGATVPLLGRGWVQPHWLERQADPASPAYVVGGADPSNVTGRNWTLLGSVGDAVLGGVDARGLVVTRPNSWSVDWWIRSEQRWHFPSRETTVRQRLIDGTPVVVTAMRIPGGDVEHRSYAVSSEAPCVVVEIENMTPVPVAVTIAVRPYGLTGQASIESIELVGREVLVNNELAVVLPREPGQVVASNLAGGDSAMLLADDQPGSTLSEPLKCQAGLAQAAFSFALVHTGITRFQLPFPAPATRRKRRTKIVSSASGAVPLPTSTQVAAGWEAHTSTGARFVLPSGKVSETFDRARRSLLLFQRGTEIHAEPLTRPGLNWRDAAPILGALDRMGWHREVGEVISALPQRQKTSGEIEGRRGEIDGTSAALASAGDHLRMSQAPEIAEVLAPTVARAAQFIERQRNSRGEREPLTEGLLPARDVGGHLEFRYADNFWALRGLLNAALILRTAGEADGAADVERFAADLRVDLLGSLEGVASRFGDDALPATPHRSVDERAIDALVAVWPTGVLRADHPMMLRTAEVLRLHHLHDEAHHNTIGPRGLGVYRTARLAMVELMAGDPRALHRLDWLASAASPTGAWPRAVHPTLGTGTVGEGHHGGSVAHFVTLVRALMVQEMVGDEPSLSLLSVMPTEWLGQGIEVHDAPTAYGTLSYAIRWHGERPALLWELTAADSHSPGQTQPAVTLRVPGLDPSWSSNEPRGEALLAAPTPVGETPMSVDNQHLESRDPGEGSIDLTEEPPTSFS